MMVAPVDSPLESYYAAATNQARRLVASRYMLEECDPNSLDYPKSDDGWREVWRVNVPDDVAPQDFILAIPNTFPDHLPKTYLPVDTVETLEQIPHLDSKRFLCGFDEGDAKPNADDPGGVALRVLERAITVFKDGIASANHEDYAEELQAYWALDSDIIALSLIEPDTALSSATLLHLLPAWRNYAYLIAVTQEVGKEWLKAVGCASKVEAQTIPFLHLQTIGVPPLPRNNGEIYALLESQDTSYLETLKTYLQRSKRPSAVLFSAPTVKDGRMLGVWWHPLVAHEVNRGPGNHRRHTGVVPGFMSITNKSGVMAELTLRYKQAKIIRAVVERIDRTRLFERTIGIARSALEFGANVIGCGSVGSFAVASLSQSGVVDRFRIIDPDKLRPENVQRHYCGMSEIGEYKVEATARKLHAHYPHVKCKTYTNDVLEIIRTLPTLLASSSLTLVTVADIAIERRLNQLYKNTPTFGVSPLCFMWVEPHMLAGHVLFLRRDQPGCFECAFDEHFRFKNRVLKNPAEFSRREAGCQSTFIPYSGLDAVQFVTTASRFLIRALETSENKIFSWIGDAENARARGIELGQQWESATSFSFSTTPLSPNPLCRVCGANA